MFFEQKICILGSCDTEDGSNDYENTALITGIHYGLNRNSNRKQLFLIVKILHNIKVFTFP